MRRRRSARWLRRDAREGVDLMMSPPSPPSPPPPPQTCCSRHAALVVRGCLDWVCRTPIKLSTSTHVNMNISMTGTPLIFAAMSGSALSCDKLLACGASIDACNANGDTALMCASYFGHVQIVSLLLSRGASTACTNHDGATALIYSAECGNFHTVRTLVESGKADVSAVDSSGCNALIIAKDKGFSDIAMFLQTVASIVQ